MLVNLVLGIFSEFAVKVMKLGDDAHAYLEQCKAEEEKEANS